MKPTLRLSLNVSALAIVMTLAGCAATSSVINDKLSSGCKRSHELKTSSATVDFAVGQRWRTCSGYLLTFQPDGNLVVYNLNGVAVWNSMTGGKGATRLSLQPDGNLVIYAGTRALWASGTSGNPGAVFSVQADGNVVLYSVYGKPLWQTGTTGR